MVLLSMVSALVVALASASDSERDRAELLTDFRCRSEEYSETDLKNVLASIDSAGGVTSDLGESVGITITTPPDRMGSVRAVLAEALCTIRNPRKVEFRPESSKAKQPAVILCVRGACSLPLRTVVQMQEAVSRMRIGSDLCHESCRDRGEKAS